MANRFISVADAAGLLGISKITLYRHCEQGILPSVKLGGRRLVPESALDDLLVAAKGTGGRA